MDIPRRACGRSDLKLPVVGIGCWSFGGGEYWGRQEQGDVDAVVNRALDLGCNYFDTAEAYNNGASESALGHALGLRRDEAIIGTKISPSNTQPETMIQHCEASLRRLRTEYIDLYMIHWPITPEAMRHFTDDESVLASPPVVEDVVETLLKLQTQGKIRFLGVSNFGPERLAEITSVCGNAIVANELPYNLLARAVEDEILTYCHRHGVGVIGYMTLLQGLLTDRYTTLDDVPPWQRRTRHFDSSQFKLTRHGLAGAEGETEQALREIRAIAEECEVSMATLAIRWAISRREITSALLGCRNLAELEANVAAVVSPLSQDVVERLNVVTTPLKEALGESFDYYEHPDHDRTR